VTILAFSGGKDSTALALRMAELGEDFELLFTPTGDELPDLQAHLDRVVSATGKRLVIPPGPSLPKLIEEMNALPSWRMRWCTRLIKVLPCIAYLQKYPGSVLCIGLRADEMGREGLYGEWATYRYPLREWGWTERDVLRYCAERKLMPPPRTDCACCPYQRLSDWYWLWKKWPFYWHRCKEWEAQTGHTFRSAQRDTWPAALADLEKEFEKGRKIRGYDSASDIAPCRVCRL
jgi:3'-phosphoadenosine 5'-phosphosulfate sulfotransferase (PAPS reductase)/FAD synthetase